MTDLVKDITFLREYRRDMEQRQNEVNDLFRNSCAMILSATPFIHSFAKIENTFLLNLIPLVGLFISMSWMVSLSRINTVLEAIDKLLHEQSKFDKSIGSEIRKALNRKALLRVSVTVNEMMVPVCFICAFLVFLAYGLVSF